MKISVLQSSGNPRIILLFAGWAMDERPFRPLRVEGYDIAVVWDYRSSDLDVTALGAYGEIVVVAWSFGIIGASSFLDRYSDHFPITSTIAVNSTLHPVDDRLGIPESIFRGTLRGLDERNLRKFYLRMAGSTARFNEFAASLPQRPVDELRDELKAVPSARVTLRRWDVAVFAGDDRIIPSAAQREAWSREACRVIEIPGPHLPDFVTLLPTLLTDKQLVASRFLGVRESYNDHAAVQHSIARRLVELWNPSATNPLDIIEIGCGTCSSTRCYLPLVAPRSLQLWDFNVSDAPAGAIVKQCDAEAEIMRTPAESADVIFSASTIQWFNSLPAFFRNAARVLRRGGLLVVSSFDDRNFSELQAAAGIRNNFPSVSSVMSMIPPSLEIVVSEREAVTLKFDTPADLLRHIRLTGVNALSRRTSPASVRAILRDFPLDDEGRAPLTYSPYYLILRKL